MRGNVGKVKRVAVALSGGVDSAVAALLLKGQGYAVICVHMVCWDENAPGCSSSKDRVDAVKVAARLDIPLVVWNFVKEYEKEVLDYFYSEYAAGRTPNPDVMCNSKIKFGLFLRKALNDLDVDFVATGHYARIEKETSLDGKDTYKLLKGVDSAKDQSYFLYNLSQGELSKVMFPVGSLTKRRVREIAREHNLPVWDKPDSQGICFIGKVHLEKFLRRRIKEKTGNVLDVKGNVIGKHKGAWFYTIGQRHGISYTSHVSYSSKGPRPLYVVDKDVDRNTVTVGPGEKVMCSSFIVKSACLYLRRQVRRQGLSRIGIIPNRDYPDLRVRIRHLGELYPVDRISSTDSGKTCFVRLSKKAFAVAPGQSAVFYDGDVVVGGGIISYS